MVNFGLAHKNKVNLDCQSISVNQCSFRCRITLKLISTPQLKSSQLVSSLYHQGDFNTPTQNKKVDSYDVETLNTFGFRSRHETQVNIDHYTKIKQAPVSHNEIKSTSTTKNKI